MRSMDYLTPFAEVGRGLCDGAESSSVMNLIAEKITKALNLKGCYIKMKHPQGGHMELLASCGLSEKFLFSKSDDTPDYVCSHLPGKAMCVPKLQNGEITGESRTPDDRGHSSLRRSAYRSRAGSHCHGGALSPALRANSPRRSLALPRPWPARAFCPLRGNAAWTAHRA